LFLLPLRLILPMTNVRSHWGSTDRCGLLAEAERVLVQVAADERLGRSWIGQVGSALFNVGLFLLSGLAFHHWKAGAISGGIGLIVGELNLWTQPAHLSGVLDKYRTGRLEPPPPKLSLGVLPLLGDEVGFHVGLTLAF
jgi:hypothetical protein